MKSSEEKVIELPDTIKAEFASTLNKMKIKFQKNPLFFNELIKKCMLVGNESSSHIYWEDINKMLRNEYPDLIKKYIGIELLQDTRNLLEIYCCHKKELSHLLQDKEENTYFSYRQNFLDLMSDCFFNIETKDDDNLSVIGNNTSYDNE